MPNNNGEQEQYVPAQAGMMRRVRKPLFEKDLLLSGQTPLEAFPMAIFNDKADLHNACIYIGHLQMFPKMVEELELALLEVNGTRGVGAAAIKYAVQAHGNLYFPEDASKDEKKQLASMQLRYRRDGEGDSEYKNDGERR